jgi:hypothetical protein
MTPTALSGSILINVLMLDVMGRRDIVLEKVENDSGNFVTLEKMYKLIFSLVVAQGN